MEVAGVVRKDIIDAKGLFYSAVGGDADLFFFQAGFMQS